MFSFTYRIKQSVFVFALLAISLLMARQSFAEADNQGFFRYPDTDGKCLVFASEGDIWRVSLQGGIAIRLTSHLGEERFPKFDPTGKWLAVSIQEDGQNDVFVLPSMGGEPTRLTFHPDGDYVMGWTPDGNVLFRSRRESNIFGYRMYTISPSGGYPQALPLDRLALVSYEPNGDRIAFNRYSREFRSWKRYKGGWAQDIWVGNTTDFTFENITDSKINDWDGTDAFPMWHTDGRIYFLSDRDLRSNIYSMLPDGSDLKQHTFHKDFDVRWPSMGKGVIVYQHGMNIRAYNIGEDDDYAVNITLPSDRLQSWQKFTNPARYITSYDLSPDGSRLLLCARGELFTAPTQGKGLIRQLTHSSGEREKFPTWSHNGEDVICWSDRTGEEALYTINGKGGKLESLGTDNRGWHFPPVASPDGKWLAFSNEEQYLIVMNIKKPKDMKVIARGAWEIGDYAWSPDSRWLAYALPEENSNATIHIYDVKKGESHQITNDFKSNFSPAFDPEGKYLYFLSNCISNPHLDWSELSYTLDKRTMPCLVTLKPETASPFAAEADPKSEDEKPWEKGNKDDDKDKDGDDKKVTAVEIDFDGIADRVVQFPVSAGNYFSLRAVKEKVFFLSVENKGMMWDSEYDDSPRGSTLHRFNIKNEKDKVVAQGIRGYDLSQDGKKLLIWKAGKFSVQGVDEDGGNRWNDNNGDDDGDKFVDLSQWDMRVNVRDEWRQIFKETWRFQRDFFWDPNMHGVDWQAVYDKYAPLTARISTRSDLNDLIGEMFAELSCSHTYVWGGDQRRLQSHPTGLLGADLSRDVSGFYRIDNIYPGVKWANDVLSPLSALGVKAKVGDYITAVNGVSVNSVKNIWELFLNKAGKITSLTLNDEPELEEGWDVIVEPLGNEWDLRYNTWVEGRREYVSEKSDGRIAYIHLTNMGGDGLSQFARDYLPQHRKPALIMDVRNNGGGFVAEMILAHLNRQAVSIGRPRHGATYRSPQTAFHGHMAAVCNGQTGSDGETFTEGFKRLGLGPVIGTRTWGGWVGIRMDKPLVDRGMVSQPEFTGWGFDGQYLIEGWGTEPDIEVKEHPAADHLGIDPQLDRTIEYLLDKLEKYPMAIPDPPPYPNRSGFAR